MADFHKIFAESSSYTLFCHDREGWGPLAESKQYVDFTPCFTSLLATIVSLFGVFAGSIEIWWLLAKRPKLPTRKDWHYYAKLILAAGVGFATALEGTLMLSGYSRLPHDVRFWSSILQIASIGVIFAIHGLEHQRSRVPSGTVLIYWLLYTGTGLIKLRSLYVRNTVGRTSIFATITIKWFLALFVFILETFVPKRQSLYQQLDQGQKECPGEIANIFSLASFSWMTPMLKHGYKSCITEEDLWDLPMRFVSENASDRIWKRWERQKGDRGVWKALFATFGKSYICWMPLKLISDTIGYSQPQLLRLLLRYISTYSTDRPDPPAKGFLIAAAMFLATVGQSVSNNNFMNHIFEMSQTVRSGLIAIIYKKSLKLSNQGRADKNTGDIVNLMAVDTQRISEISRQGQQLWSSPFQVVLCMIQLYGLLGWPGLAGVVVMFVMLPINSYIAQLMKKYKKENLKHKDERTALTTEILNNMKSIKLYSWTEAFAAKLAHVRNEKEMKTLRQIGAVQAASRFCWNSTPFFVSCGTFALYTVVKDSPLSVDLVFPALTLFNLLTQPLSTLPTTITATIESVVAAARVKAFLEADEVQDEAIECLSAASGDGEEAVSIEQGTFTWGTEESPACLSQINFKAYKGRLSCIVGRVGSGKSSILQAILGDLHKKSGYVSVKGSVAYVAQNAWIINASVRENVLFGHRYEQKYYEKTLRACALVDDLAILPDGDLTEVGERGISLSGGQKARLQLARAVYARADVYLLDDILSAVDAQVGRHIVNHVVGPKGLLRNKCRVFATNSIPVLKDAEEISLVKEGRITESGSYSDAVSRDQDIASLIKTVKSLSDRDSEGGDEKQSSPISPSSSSSGVDWSDSELDSEKATQRDVGDDEFDPPEKTRTSESEFPVGKKGDIELAEKPRKIITRQRKETSEKGKVKWNVYRAWAAACGKYGFICWFFTVIAVQALQVGSSLWLKTWAEGNERTGGNPDVGKNVGIYFALGIATSLMLVLQTVILWMYCSVRASKYLHEQMAYAIFRSPMSFFETTPLGRIMNRFYSDIFRVDEAVVRSISELFTNLAKSGCTIIVICAATPVFTVVLIPLGILYYFIQRYYLRSNRELKRLESTTRSPIYAHFAETLSGISTIRAFRQQKRWTREDNERVDQNMKAWLPAIYANRWLSIRLELIGALVVFSTAALAITNVTKGGRISAGLVGLAMSYALSVTQALNMMVRQSIECETNLVSVERVLEYTRLPSEAAEIVPNNRPQPTWPAHGAIQFNDYSMRYRENLDLVLRNITLSIRAREKIGVVGRTGAGKSSLTLSLFRIVEAASGGIDIDNIDTSSIGLRDLRSRLAIIPQDAAMFQGTIRDNLDPDHRRSDNELWTALEHARLREHILSMPGGLEAAVLEGGSNLSQGQKQLVSLARALLTDSAILILDEATAAVDVRTDQLVQDTLRSELFKDRTIVTIAHRINTIVDCDRILVLERGQVKEFGTPAELVGRRGVFWELAKEAGVLNAEGSL